MPFGIGIPELLILLILLLVLVGAVVFVGRAILR